MRAETALHVGAQAALSARVDGGPHDDVHVTWGPLEDRGRDEHRAGSQGKHGGTHGNLPGTPKNGTSIPSPRTSRSASSATTPPAELAQREVPRQWPAPARYLEPEPPATLARTTAKSSGSSVGSATVTSGSGPAGPTGHPHPRSHMGQREDDTRPVHAQLVEPFPTLELDPMRPSRIAWEKARGLSPVPPVGRIRTIDKVIELRLAVDAGDAGEVRPAPAAALMRRAR